MDKRSRERIYTGTQSSVMKGVDVAHHAMRMRLRRACVRCVRACAACEATFLTTLSVWGYEQDEEVSVVSGIEEI